MLILAFLDRSLAPCLFQHEKHPPQLINSLLSSADAEAFRDPVDWRGLGLHDYPHIIKRPMDLGTVKLRLERGSYATAEACAADVRLIWENCRTYNTGGVPRNLHKVKKRGLFFVDTFVDVLLFKVPMLYVLRFSHHQVAADSTTCARK